MAGWKRKLSVAFGLCSLIRHLTGIKALQSTPGHEKIIVHAFSWSCSTTAEMQLTIVPGSCQHSSQEHTLVYDYALARPAGKGGGKGQRGSTYEHMME